MARAFIAKPVYNLQTTSALIDRLRIDRTLRVICGWRHCNKIPSESKFSRLFREFSQQRIAAYDTSIIRNYSKEQNHRPIIDINPKNSKVLKAQIALAKSEKKILQPLKLYNDSDDQHYNQRSSVAPQGDFLPTVRAKS